MTNGITYVIKEEEKNNVKIGVTHFIALLTY